MSTSQGGMTSFTGFGARRYNTMVTQLYSLSSWTTSKSLGNGADGLPYVGFPGLTLTPIPENPLLDSMLQDDGLDSCEREKWLKEEPIDNKWNPDAMKNGSLPNHWIMHGRDEVSPVEDVEAAKDCNTSSKTCSVDLNSTQTFLPKDDATATERKRSRLVKLLLFALCGVVVVAAIVIWIFSPVFT